MTHDEQGRAFDDALFLWHAGDADVPPLDVGGTEVSLCVTVRIPADGWNTPILSWGEAGGRCGFRIETSETETGPALWFELETDWDNPRNNRALRVTAPAAVIGAEGRHVVVVRFSGPRLELFVDGVLLDEEWPVGGLKPAPGCPLQIDAREDVDCVAVWSRVLSDDEIAELSGGAEAVRKSELAFFGPEPPTLNYWKPRGHNTSVGDCMPFSHDGRFHMVYLFDRRHHGSKWGLGAHQWAHASSADLKTWEHHPLAVPVSREWEGSICTGSTFFHDGTYYAFYAARTHDGTPGQLTASTSTDGVHFTKGEPLFTLDPPYEPVNARDPNVFRDAETGLFHMLVTTSVLEPPLPGHADCLAHMVSSDLQTWEQQEPVWVPGECPDCFEWNGFHYLFTGHEGVTRYRMSRSWFGPWERPRVDLVDGPQSYVMKTAAFGEGRRIGAAWIGEHAWGGHTVFREMVQHDDGTLGTAWVPEMVPPAGEPVALSPEALAGEVWAGAGRVAVSAPCAFGAAAARGVPRNMRLRVRVEPGTGAAAFGLAVRGAGNYEAGYELRIEPFRRKIGWRPCRCNSNEERERFALYDVDGLDRPFTLDVLVLNDLLDICVDGRRTLIVRMEERLEGDGLFFFAYCGEAVFETIEVRPLT